MLVGEMGNRKLVVSIEGGRDTSSNTIVVFSFSGSSSPPEAIMSRTCESVISFLAYCCSVNAVNESLRAFSKFPLRNR